ncbi:TfoX/Sxy family protein, partial [Clostridium perfringens]
MARQSPTNGNALPLSQSLLCGHIRAALRDRGAVREVQMFGGLSFLFDEKMIVAAQKNGDLLVRIDPTKSKDLLCQPHTRQAEMGKGR